MSLKTCKICDKNYVKGYKVTCSDVCRIENERRVRRKKEARKDKRKILKKQILIEIKTLHYIHKDNIFLHKNIYLMNKKCQSSHLFSNEKAKEVFFNNLF